MDVALKILPPIDPVAVYAIGLNYKRHAAVIGRLFSVME